MLLPMRHFWSLEYPVHVTVAQLQWGLEAPQIPMDFDIFGGSGNGTPVDNNGLLHHAYSPLPRVERNSRVDTQVFVFFDWKSSEDSGLLLNICSVYRHRSRACKSVSRLEAKSWHLCNYCISRCIFHMKAYRSRTWNAINVLIFQK